jgi:hypothetical protein
MVCSMFSRSGWSIVRSTSLAMGGTSKKRQSLHLHKVLTQSNNVSPRTFQTALILYNNECGVVLHISTSIWKWNLDMDQSEMQMKFLRSMIVIIRRDQ